MFEIIEFEWSKKYRVKGICPACKKNKIRLGLKTCSPTCNIKYYNQCCIIHDWSYLKSQALKRDNYKCVLCQNTKTSLEVDHIRPVALFPELQWELSNLQTLCIDCHKNKTAMDILEINYQKKKKLGML